jgi:hypothetical protein
MTDETRNAPAYPVRQRRRRRERARPTHINAVTRRRRCSARSFSGQQHGGGYERLPDGEDRPDERPSVIRPIMPTDGEATKAEGEVCRPRLGSIDEADEDDDSAEGAKMRRAA